MGLAQGWCHLSETKFHSPETLDYLLISKTEKGIPQAMLDSIMVNLETKTNPSHNKDNLVTRLSYRYHANQCTS